MQTATGEVPSTWGVLVRVKTTKLAASLLSDRHPSFCVRRS